MKARRAQLIVFLTIASIAPIALIARAGHAQPESPHGIALLPLDADAKLELYGQPVASELARALAQGGLDVVVVGPKMAVPERARLVVDGTITVGKGDTVTLSARIRDSRDGTVYDTLVVTAASLTAIDHAEEELSAKVLPAVRGRLATLLELDHAAHVVKPTAPPSAVAKLAAPQTLMVELHADTAAGSAGTTLRAELATAVVPWAARRHHEVHIGAAQPLVGPADLAVTLDVLALDIALAEAGPIPMARARVRLRISDPHGLVFDRVIRTDTIVGDRGVGDRGVAGNAALIARVAREILSIAEPQVRRRIPSWF